MTSPRSSHRDDDRRDCGKASREAYHGDQYLLHSFVHVRRRLGGDVCVQSCRLRKVHPHKTGAAIFRGRKKTADLTLAPLPAPSGLKKQPLRSRTLLVALPSARPATGLLAAPSRPACSPRSSSRAAIRSASEFGRAA